MKKIITLLLVVTMITACMVPTVFAAGTTVSVSSATAVPGDTVALNISINGNPGFVSGKVTVSYDTSALELVSMSNVMFQGMTYNNQANHASAMPVTGDGTLCTATFKVIATASCTADVTATVSGMRDADGNLINVGSGSGTVTVSVPHTHSHSATVTAPTCEGKGYTTYTCSCGDTYTANEVAALGHSYGAWTVTKEATCTDKGEKTRTCSGCGDVETEAIPANGHSYGDWTVTKEATCTDKGEKTRTCSGCGDVETEAIPANGHSYTYTANADNTHTGVCSDCGNQVTGAHEYENNGYCACGNLKPGTVTDKDEDLDDVPATSDITFMVYFGVVSVISMIAAVAYGLKRKTVK